VYPVVFSFGPITVYSFGVMMALGFYVAATVSVAEFRRRGGDPEQMWNFLLWVFLAGLAGSKLLSVGADFGAFFRHPIEQLMSGSGFVWYGGLIGGFAAAWPLSRRYKFNFGTVLECTSLGLPVGQAIGRLGCHVAGDGDWGIVTAVPWGVAYEKAIVGWPHAPGVVVHPTPLYEFSAYMTVFLILYAIRKRDYPNGTMFCLYLVGASTARFLVEFLRLNPVISMGMTQAQLIAIVLFLGGISWLVRHRSQIVAINEASA
jgi:phosphatidylglycerol:prolipoprotein diacylglycerol transferase